MAQTKFIRVGLGEDDTHNFVLYAGMEVKELVGLFESAFWDTLSTLASQNIWILGLENYSNGSTTTLSAVCEDPSFLSSQVMYRLMLSGTPPRNSLPTPPAQIEDTMSADLARAREEMFSSQPLVASNAQTQTQRTSEEEDDDYYSDSDDSENQNDQNQAASSPLSAHSDEAVVTALSSFVAECEGASLFTEDEARALMSLLQGEPEKGCDTVVRAAYLVCYANGRDAQLLYAVLKDVAGKQLSSEGREEHIAQEELIDMVESLMETRSIHQREAIFLLELVVRKAQPIVKIYQDYAHHCDYSRIISDIAKLAKHYLMQQDQKLAPTPPPRPPPPPSPPGTTPNTMRKQDSVRSEGWEVDSMDTVDSDDELVSPRNQKQPSSSSLPTTRSGLAAALSANARPFYPGDKPDGEDTAASVLEAVVTRAHLEGALSPGDAEVAMQLIKSRNTLLFNAQARFADEPTGLRELVLAVVRAERARRQAVENAHASHDEPSWASLPKPLLNLLQVAESQGLVQHDDAILVCNAFIHNFELVHAGWEVYEDEGDEAELLDTILRVLKSGRLHQQMTLYEEGGSESYEEDGGGVDGDDEEDDYEAGKAVGEDKHERLPEVAISVLRTVAGRLEASGALTAQESDALIELAEEGDPALHACFEVYAADNDLEELLSSLQSLALKVGSKNKGPAASRKFEETESPEEVSSGGDDIAENEDSDQDEAEDPSSRGMAAELFDLLKCLEEDGKLSSSEVNILRTLIDKREPRVLAAYDAYVMFRDVEDLIDTLERIARLALQGSLDTPKENSEDNAKNSSSGMMSKLFPSYTNSGKSDEAVADTDSSNSSSSIGEDEDESLELGNEERKAMLLMLLERGALSHEEVIVLMRKMLVHDDSLVAYAFEEFQHHQDFKTFLTNLKQLADPNASQFTLDDSSSSDSESSHDSELNRDSINDDTNQQDDDDYSDDDENYEDDDDDKEEGNEDEANLGRVFMNVVREMELSEAESMALRLCIARDDPHVRAALEVFKLERDEDDLRDTLKRLSRRTVEGMMREIENNEN